MKRPKIRTLFYSFGYAETADASAVVISHETGFKTAHGMIKSLVQLAHGCANKRNATTCCAEAIALNPNARYCSSCGKDLQVKTDSKESEVERIIEWLRALSGSSDTTFDAEEILGQHGWSLGLLKTGVDAIEVQSLDHWIRGALTYARISRFHLTPEREITAKPIYVYT